VALLGLSALLVGTLRATNTWDFPTYLGLATLAGALALGPGRYVGLVRAGLATAGIAVGLYALSSLLFWPYLSRYELFYSGVLPIKTPTVPGQFLLINGFLLFAAGSFLAYSLRRAWPRAVDAEPLRRLRTAAAGAYYSVALPLPTARSQQLGVAVAMGALAAGAGLAAMGRGTLGIVVVSGIVLAALVVLRHRSRERLWWAAIVATALGALALPELVAVKGDVGRMNTVFKFWLQAWVLLALLAGPSLVWVFRRLAATRPGGRVGVPTGWAAVWVVALALLAASAAVYPLLATPTRLRLRFTPLAPTLDGMAYMDHATYQDKGRDLELPADAAAIRWMLENVQGTPVILEGNAPLYHWGSRFSVYTGLPTILGWDWHQRQQRTAYPARIEERQKDVATAYGSPDSEAAWNVIRKYGVSFIVVGGLERAYYAAGGLEKFDRMVGRGLDVAYRGDGVTIYRVVGT
jgi:YYY domain-containing protein